MPPPLLHHDSQMMSFDHLDVDTNPTNWRDEQYLIFGVACAFQHFPIDRTIANRFLARASVYSTDQSVEWQYAFDIHCNAFMPVIVLLYLIQMVFMKILVKDAWICSALGNTLYMIAIVYYCYITFLGYNGEFLFRVKI
jgi:hypothetical protein